MTYAQILDKIKRVFDSCVLYSQIDMAYDYCSRLNARYNFDYQYGNSSDYSVTETYIYIQRRLAYERVLNIKNNA